MINHITLMGRLTRDPELRHTPNGTAVASFTLAVDREFKNQNGERETDFIDIVAWRGTAEFVSKYFSKGRMAIVTGRLQIRNWTDKEGGKRRAAEVVADNIYFGDSKRDSGYTEYGNQSGYNQGNGYNQSSSYSQGGGYGDSGFTAPAPTSDFSMLETNDSDLPF